MTNSLRIFVLVELTLSSFWFLPGAYGILPFVGCLAGFLGSYAFVGGLLASLAYIHDCDLSFFRVVGLWAPAIWFDKTEWLEKSYKEGLK